MQRFGEEIFPENNAEWFIFVTPYCHKRNRSDGAALLHPKSAGDKKANRVSGLHKRFFGNSLHPHGMILEHVYKI